MTTKETQDFLALGRASAKAVRDAKADGTIDWKDLPKCAPVLVALRDAVNGAKAVPDELKNSTPEELVAVATESFSVLVELVEAFVS